MKKYFTLIIALLILMFCSSLFAQSQTKNYDYKNFTKVEAGWGMQLTITQSDDYSIVVNADERDFKYLKVEKDGSSLKFYIDKNSYRKRSDINITIKMPALTELELSGGAEANIDMNISSKEFECELSGGAELNGNLKCGNVSLGSSGGGTTKLSGSGGNLNADGSGGSEFKLKDFSVNDVNSELSGGSELTVTMNGNLTASQSGGSKIVYYGNANSVEFAFKRRFKCEQRRLIKYLNRNFINEVPTSNR